MERINGIRVRNQLSLIAQSGPCFEPRLQPHHHPGPGATWEWCQIPGTARSYFLKPGLALSNSWGPYLLSANKAEYFLEVVRTTLLAEFQLESLATKQSKIIFLISLNFVLSPHRASLEVQCSRPSNNTVLKCADLLTYEFFTVLYYKFIFFLKIFFPFFFKIF